MSPVSESSRWQLSGCSGASVETHLVFQSRALVRVGFVCEVCVSVLAPELNAAVAAAEAAVIAGAAGVGRASEGIELLEAVERHRRLAAVAAVDALVEIDRSGAYLEHGHANARTMIKHVCRVSSAQANRFDKIARMVRACGQIEAAWRRGKLSEDQAAVLARAYANPRVRDRIVANQSWFLKQAKRPFATFEKRVAQWVNLADDDGAAPKPDPSHVQRDVAIVQDHFAKQWSLRGSFGSLQGSQVHQVWGAYVDAEFFADWAAAEAEHGPATCRDLLPRTDAQRRADAFAQICADAAANPNRSVAMATEHVVVWSAASLEEMIRRFAGGTPRPINPDTHMCRSLDGNSLDETAAFADFVVSKFRRVVQDARSVCVDMSETQRFFTGLARLGVQLSADTCYWPGCDRPVVQCQADHLRPAARGGPTDQCNGAPACQHHNRTKERGYTVTRRNDGTIEVRTPTGELIPR